MAKEIKLANFKFSKLEVQRKDKFEGKLSISPNINIKNIEKIKTESSKLEFLKVDFKFEVSYGELGLVSLEGNMHLMADAKIVKETTEGWKSKKLDTETSTLILNFIMQKASLKALDLEEQVGLPLHVQLPRLQTSKKE